MTIHLGDDFRRCGNLRHKSLLSHLNLSEKTCVSAHNHVYRIVVQIDITSIETEK